jgi:hypothetical protein
MTQIRTASPLLQQTKRDCFGWSRKTAAIAGHELTTSAR